MGQPTPTPLAKIFYVGYYSYNQLVRIYFGALFCNEKVQQGFLNKSPNATQSVTT